MLLLLLQMTARLATQSGHRVELARQVLPTPHAASSSSRASAATERGYTYSLVTTHFSECVHGRQGRHDTATVLCMKHPAPSLCMHEPPAEKALSTSLSLAGLQHLYF